ncbi:hypothetical protein DYB37_008021 [Aphanomyces astaci]|uniref:Phosphoribosyltransferase domain-containing protein n=1 Tax=Aphanomyces astaci TaxID=112090 RepID=A0A3R7CAX5_APHAT|nr:hypothetical protein DYB35_004370 [Aphanomyces astaci]RHZ20546.1 hypothetical protein DYB37_008021 [Aphanomyces astaci]
MPHTTHPHVKSLGLPENSKVILSTHPVLAHKLTKLRDAKTDANLFRHLLREITFYLGYGIPSTMMRPPFLVLGMYRNSNSLLPVQYYNKLPKECHIDCAIVLEPLINTAGTIIATVAILKVWGVSQIKIISTIASKDGLKDLFAKHPDVEVIVAAIDDTLSESGVIVPGLGDAGDRQFDTDVHHISENGGNHKRKHSEE